MKLLWMPQARADLTAIYEYIAEGSAQNAERVIERVSTSIFTDTGD